MASLRKQHCCRLKVGIVSALFSLIFVSHKCAAQRIAVIGGGISGTFVAKYLVDYDKDCSLDALTLFDPQPLGEPITKATPNEASAQGSRVGTLRLDDGRIIELGASILTESFSYIIEMAQVGNLTLGEPFDTGIPDEEHNMREGMVIYNGDGDVALNTANITTLWKKFALLWRYNIDLIRVDSAVKSAIQNFKTLQEQLRDPEKNFYDSPEAMWKAVNLKSLVAVSLDDYCDSLGVPKEVPWWRYFLYGQGSLRQELLEAINLVNYNQDNSQINAMSGLGSFSVASRKFYSISGGNVQLVASAFDLAKANRQTMCSEKPDAVSHSRQRISTEIGSLEGFELFAEDGSLVGEYDIVIVAAPMPMSKINFYVKSHIDESVLQDMPLGGLVENTEESVTPEDHEGHSPFPKKLPLGASYSYTQVVTTIVREAELQTSYFSIDPEHVPRGVYMTPRGKASEYNVTSIAQISSKDGLYKVFSSQPLPKEALESFFGPAVKVEYEKIWGSAHGGATPDYDKIRASGDAQGVPFLLYDGATGFHGHTKSGALYYPNSMELTFACIELSAMGAKAVAKLIAKRLEWLPTARGEFNMGEEL
jgi:prenylcysteine oxidase/farnesylcysteine lyase